MSERSALSEAAAAVLVVVPGGFVLGLGARVAYLWTAMRTGDARLDRAGIRGRLLVWLLSHWPTVTARDARALVAMVHEESRGDPVNYRHDLAATGGPGVGPLAANRRTVTKLGLWFPPAGAEPDSEVARDAFLSLASDEGRGLAWGAAIFKAYRKGKDPDPKLADPARPRSTLEAVQRFNGFGDGAKAYRGRVEAFAVSTWGAGALGSA